MRRLSVSVLCLALVGCGGEETSVLRLWLTDAPGQFESVPVTIQAVEARYEGEKVAEPAAYAQAGQAQVQQQAQKGKGEGEGEGQWLRLMEQEQQHDLLQLQNGQTATLGQRELPVGYYNCLRIRLRQAQVVVGGKTHELQTPAEGTALEFRFQLRAGEDYDMVLDFDAGSSVQQRSGGGYALDPDVTVQQFRLRQGPCSGAGCPS